MPSIPTYVNDWLRQFALYPGFWGVEFADRTEVFGGEYTGYQAVYTHSQHEGTEFYGFKRTAGGEFILLQYRRTFSEPCSLVPAYPTKSY